MLLWAVATSGLPWNGRVLCPSAPASSTDFAGRIRTRHGVTTFDAALARGAPPTARKLVGSSHAFAVCQLPVSLLPAPHADEMGLGKSVELVATILSNRFRPDEHEVRVQLAVRRPAGRWL